MDTGRRRFLWGGMSQPLGTYYLDLPTPAPVPPNAQNNPYATFTLTSQYSYGDRFSAAGYGRPQSSAFATLAGPVSTFSRLPPAIAQPAIPSVASYGRGSSAVGWPGSYGGGLGGSYWSYGLPTRSSYGGSLGGLSSLPFGMSAAAVFASPTYDWALLPEPAMDAIRWGSRY